MRVVKRILRWFGRILIGFVALIVLLLSIGFVYESAASAAAADDYPGRLVDVGGYRLHIYCVGDGSPILLLEAGMGESSLTWATIQTELADQTQTRVCAYDRAGVGWSDDAPTEMPRSIQSMVTDLYNLLTNSEISGPFVFVGHSLGGFVARLYAAQHPEDVAGIIFLDSAHEDITEVVPQFADALQSQRSVQTGFAALARVGITRALGSVLLPSMDPSFPQALVPHIPIMYSSGAMETANRELSALPDTWAQIRESRASQPTWSFPIAVLYAAGSVEANPEWFNLQNDLTTLSTQSEIIHAEDSGHYIHYTEPELVTDTARNLVNLARGT